MRYLLPLTVVLALIGFSCRSNLPTPPSSKNVQLQLEDVTATEAWLRVRLTDGISAPTTVSLNGKVILSLSNPPADTVIADDALLPRQTYLYTITRSTLFGFGESSTLDVTTMDTTGHQMVWEVDTLGGGMGSGLLDVAILNDTLAYAVGMVYGKDSLGRWINPPYNLARWNGRTWELLYVQFWVICGQSDLTSPTTSALVPLPSGQIWIACYVNEVVKWEDSSQTNLTCLPVSFGMLRLYAADPNSVFGVGMGGHVVHFDGSSWQEMLTGTDLDLVDISGQGNGSIWMAALDRATYQKSSIIRYDGSEFQTVYVYDPTFQNLRRQDSITGIVTSVYADTKHSLWVTTSSGEYYCPSNTKGEGKLSWAPDYLAGFTRAVRGDAPNNVFLAGDYTTLVHFNGYSWHHYRELMRLWDNTSAIFYGIAVKGANVFAVGEMNGYAVVYRGRRIN